MRGADVPARSQNECVRVRILSWPGVRARAVELVSVGVGERMSRRYRGLRGGGQLVFANSSPCHAGKTTVGSP